MVSERILKLQISFSRGLEGGNKRLSDKLHDHTPVLFLFCFFSLCPYSFFAFVHMFHKKAMLQISHQTGMQFLYTFRF